MRIEIFRGYAPTGRYKPKKVRPMDEHDDMLFMHCNNGQYEIVFRDWPDVKKLLKSHGVQEFSMVDNS